MIDKSFWSFMADDLDRVHGQFSIRTLGPTRAPDTGSWIGAWALGLDCLASIEGSANKREEQDSDMSGESGSRIQRILSRVCVL